MKKIHLISILILLTALCACSSAESEKSTEKTETEGIYIDQEVEKQEQETVAEADSSIAISDKAVTVSYEGDLYIYDMAAADDLIFLAGLNPDSGGYEIHRMEIEDTTSEKLPLEIPNDMMVQGMNVDREGKLHFFLTDTDRSVTRCEMWVSDQDGNLLKQMDIRDTFLIEDSALIALSAFAIDGEGRYYISGIRLAERSQSGITILDGDGKKLGLVNSQDMTLWNRRTIATGSDGRVFVAGYTADDDISVVSIDPEGLCIGERYADVLPTGYGDCSMMKAGVRADLFIYGADGIYAYNLGEERGNKLVDKAEFPFSWEGTFCYDFLPDGRFLMIDGDVLMYQITINGQEYPVPGELYQDITFYYVPVASKLAEGE